MNNTYASPLKFEELYRMSDHEVKVFDSHSSFITVMRVPHGWIYTMMDKGAGVMSSVFVPFTDAKGEA